jgi:hypothetical protein
VVLEDHVVETIDDKSKKALENKNDKDVQSAGDGLSLGGQIGGYAGIGTKSGAKFFGDDGTDKVQSRNGDEITYKPHNPSEVASTDDAIVSGFSMGWLGDLLAIIGGLIDFSEKVQHAKQYGATSQEKIELAKDSFDNINNLAKTAKDACMGASFIIEKFQEHMSSVQQAADTAGPLGAETIPGIGLAISALSLIAATIGVLPQMQRLAAQTVATEIHESAPEPDVVNLLAMARTKKSVVVLIEQACFTMAKSATMIGLHIAEIASAGGFGIPMAAKLSLTLVGILHTAAHAARAMIEEHLSAKAKARYFGAHEEGAARGMVERDPGTAADVVIHSAQKKKDFGSRIIVSSYDIPDDEIDHMLHHEIRDKMLKGMKEEGDPRTIQKKWEDVKKSAAEFIDGNEATGEKSLKESLKSTFTPKSDKEKARDQRDLEVLAEAKNRSNYKGKADREVGFADSMRSTDAIDKSFLKVRQHMLRQDPTLKADKLPWSQRDEEIKQRRQRIRDESMIPPHLRKNAEGATYVGVTNMIRQAKTATGPDAMIQLEYLERKAAEKKRAEELEKEKVDAEFLKNAKKKAKK